MSSMAGDKLKILRKQTGLNQEDFARSIIYNRSYYATVEEGHKPLSAAMAEKICKVYNLPLDYFVEKPAEDINSEAATQLRNDINEILKLCDEDALRQIFQIAKTFVY